MAWTPALMVAGAGALGSLPESWRQLDQVCVRPTATTDMIAEVVATDAGLTTRLLRLANSPMFGLSGRIDRIDRAVSLIGTRQVRDLALAVCVIDRFAGIPDTLVSMQAFWKRSLAAALLSRAIASRRRESNIEGFFVVGLLHDIGALLMYQVAERESAAALSLLARGATIVDAERTVFGFDHADVGQYLLESWGLPQSLAFPVGRHHAPCVGAAFRTESAITHISSTIVDLLQISSLPVARTPALDPEAWAAIGLPIEALGDIVGDLDASLEAVTAVFFPVVA